MRALSLSTLTVFLFMFAAHLSWQKTSSAISSKIELHGAPIFSGPHITQRGKLDRLSELKELKTELKKDLQETTPPFAAQLLSSDVHLTQLHKLTPKEDHLLKAFAKEFSQKKIFDQTTIKGIAQTKGYPDRSPEAKALKKTLKKLQKRPELRDGNYTKLFFEIYEEIAMNPASYDNHYEMRETLSRMSFERHEIDEFVEGLYQEETQKY